MKKKYTSPDAELLAFSDKDVMTSSRDWNTPTLDFGNSDGDWNWDTEGDTLTVTEKN